MSDNLSDVGHAATDVGHAVTDVGHDATDVGYDATDVGYDVTDVGNVVRHIGNLVSDVGKQVSDMGKGFSDTGKNAGKTENLTEQAGNEGFGWKTCGNAFFCSLPGHQFLVHDRAMAVCQDFCRELPRIGFVPGRAVLPRSRDWMR